MKAFTANMSLPRPKNILIKGVHLLYEICIKPKNIDDGKRAQELIFNIIALTMLLVITALGSSVVIGYLYNPSYIGINPTPFFILMTFFASLLA